MNNNFVYTNSPNHYFDTIYTEQTPNIRIAPVSNIEPLKYTHYDFLHDYFKKYYEHKHIDPIILLHFIKIIELSLSHVQNTQELIYKYKDYFKL